MGSILKPFQARQRFIPRNTKHEESLQRQVCTFLRMQYPHVIFRSDFASGLHLTINQARTHRSLQSGRAWPDLFIYESSTVGDKDGMLKTYHGLALELKKEGTAIIMTRGQRKGMLTSDPHIQEQALMLRTLLNKGYYANFAVGFDEAVKIINWYFNRPMPKNTEMF